MIIIFLLYTSILSSIAPHSRLTKRPRTPEPMEEGSVSKAIKLCQAEDDKMETEPPVTIGMSPSPAFIGDQLFTLRFLEEGFDIAPHFLHGTNVVDCVVKGIPRQDSPHFPVISPEFFFKHTTLSIEHPYMIKLFDRLCEHACYFDFIPSLSSYLVSQIKQGASLSTVPRSFLQLVWEHLMDCRSTPLIMPDSIWTLPPDLSLPQELQRLADSFATLLHSQPQDLRELAKTFVSLLHTHSENEAAMYFIVGCMAVRLEVLPQFYQHSDIVGTLFLEEISTHIPNDKVTEKLEFFAQTVIKDKHQAECFFTPRYHHPHTRSYDGSNSIIKNDIKSKVSSTKKIFDTWSDTKNLFTRMPPMDTSADTIWDYQAEDTHKTNYHFHITQGTIHIHVTPLENTPSSNDNSPLLSLHIDIPPNTAPLSIIDYIAKHLCNSDYWPLGTINNEVSSALHEALLSYAIQHHSFASIYEHMDTLEALIHRAPVHMMPSCILSLANAANELPSDTLCQLLHAFTVKLLRYKDNIYTKNNAVFQATFTIVATICDAGLHKSVVKEIRLSSHTLKGFLVELTKRSDNNQKMTVAPLVALLPTDIAETLLLKLKTLAPYPPPFVQAILSAVLNGHLPWSDRKTHLSILGTLKKEPRVNSGLAETASEIDMITVIFAMLYGNSDHQDQAAKLLKAIKSDGGYDPSHFTRVIEGLKHLGDKNTITPDLAKALLDFYHHQKEHTNCAPMDPDLLSLLLKFAGNNAYSSQPPEPLVQPMEDLSIEDNNEYTARLTIVIENDSSMDTMPPLATEDDNSMDFADSALSPPTMAGLSAPLVHTHA